LKRKKGLRKPNQVVSHNENIKKGHVAGHKTGQNQKGGGSPKKSHVEKRGATRTLSKKETSGRPGSSVRSARAEKKRSEKGQGGEKTGEKQKIKKREPTFKD